MDHALNPIRTEDPCLSSGSYNGFIKKMMFTFAKLYTNINVLRGRVAYTFVFMVSSLRSHVRSRPGQCRYLTFYIVSGMGICHKNIVVCYFHDTSTLVTLEPEPSTDHRDRVVTGTRRFKKQ